MVSSGHTHLLFESPPPPPPPPPRQKKTKISNTDYDAQAIMIHWISLEASVNR